MNPTADPLAGLRGYHLPEAISWWPPAPGWWGLLLMLLIFLGSIIWVIVRWRQRQRPVRLARAELKRLRVIFEQDKDSAAFTRGISRLLRRYALSRFPREQVAGLAGERWLAFLDAQGGRGQFTNGIGRWLIEAPYRPGVPVSAEALGSLIENWIVRLEQK